MATSLVSTRTGFVHSSGGGAHGAASSPANKSRLTSSSIPKSKLPLSSEPGPWISSILKGWDNPVFHPARAAIPQVILDCPDAATDTILHGQRHQCSHHAAETTFTESCLGLGARISKEALRNAEVIAQVDKKFILVRLNWSKGTSGDGDGESGDGSLLVIVDQHAADERVRIEGLMNELCTTPQSNPSLATSIISTLLEKPLSYDVSTREYHLLKTHQRHFTNWGILYDVPAENVSADGKGNETRRLIVRSLPPGIAERCVTNPRLLIDLLRTEIWQIYEQGAKPQAIPVSNTGDEQSWVTRIHTCPQGIIDMLNSRACRSAIMFNDELSDAQCKTLISRLAKCMFPFQCAHGRPSLVPLVDLGTLDAAVDGF